MRRVRHRSLLLLSVRIDHDCHEKDQQRNQDIKHVVLRAAGRRVEEEEATGGISRRSQAALRYPSLALTVKPWPCALLPTSAPSAPPMPMSSVLSAGPN